MAKRMKKSRTPNPEAAAYRKARKLADTLGCDVLIERYLGTSTYWVTGPPEVYDMSPDEPPHQAGEVRGYSPPPGPREDPLEGNHACAGWTEVLDALEVYRDDLFFHYRGLSPEDAQALTEVEGVDALLRPWIESPLDTARGLVLADWLEDRDLHTLAERVRAGCRRLPIAFRPRPKLP